MKKSEIASLPTKYGNFKIQSFKEKDKEHLAIFTDNLPKIPYIRIHSECLTGDVLGSLKCDCGEQLEFALKTINEKGGIVLYLRQEGRGIGLFNKVNAYALQDKGFDTVEANHQLGFEADMRDFSIVEKILKHFDIKKIKLLLHDVDGVLTDGKIIISEKGEEIKHFNVLDGLGIKLLQKIGVEVGIISSRESKALQKRAEELGIKLIFQGKLKKVKIYEEVLKTLKINSQKVKNPRNFLIKKIASPLFF